MKTSELTSAALDWAVARCAYGNKRYHYGSPCFDSNTKRVYETEGLQKIGVNFAPSKDWKQGGPIIEREDVSFRKEREGLYLGYIWNGVTHKNLAEGTTPLIAAMRCYVASKLGDEVEIPEELT
jgi:hypothetical protein